MDGRKPLFLTELLKQLVGKKGLVFQHGHKVEEKSLFDLTEPIQTVLNQAIHFAFWNGYIGIPSFFLLWAFQSLFKEEWMGREKGQTAEGKKVPDGTEGMEPDKKSGVEGEKGTERDKEAAPKKKGDDRAQGNHWPESMIKGR